jgi:hypothetical protein
MGVRMKGVALVAGLVAAALAGQAAAASAPKGTDLKGLPDWSGVWSMIGNTVFDRETVQPPNAAAGITMGAREHPPLTPPWFERYTRNIAGVTDGTFPDPATFCGIPVGMPRMVNSPDGYEWVVTPKQVWMLTENSMGVRRIYTDGRKHPAKPPLSYTGHSIGHWEGDTLVVDTVGMRGEPIVDRTGLQLSDQRHIVERIRRIDADTLEDQITVTDPLALSAPWRVVKRFRKNPPGTYIFDYACAENNRNPVDERGRTITLDQNGKPLHD